MKWKPYLTPVKALDSDGARAFLDEHPLGKITILDVRQPSEYKAGHIAGAILIPLPELVNRLKEVPQDLPLLVYCLSGARSRAACQLLAGKAPCPEIINLSGGFESWEGKAALGDKDQGLTFFTGLESPQKVLEVAYGLEQGLREFYLSMMDQVKNVEVQKLFKTLADIEILHQESILKEYARITGQNTTKKTFENSLSTGAMEGGMTTREYIDYYMPNLDDSEDIVSLAMSIEAQALDMYLRAQARVKDPQGREALMKIAKEEQNHLTYLGRLMESLTR